MGTPKIDRHGCDPVRIGVPEAREEVLDGLVRPRRRYDEAHAAEEERRGEPARARPREAHDQAHPHEHLERATVLSPAERKVGHPVERALHVEDRVPVVAHDPLKRRSETRAHPERGNESQKGKGPQARAPPGAPAIAPPLPHAARAPRREEDRRREDRVGLREHQAAARLPQGPRRSRRARAAGHGGRRGP